MITFKSLTEIYNKFQGNDDCLSYYESIRFNKGIFCPHCGETDYYVLNRKFKYRCKNKECKKDFNVLTGTIFENTKISLRTWFAAIFLISTAKKGISSYQLATQLNVTQKTSWFLLHRIREMLKDKAPRLLKDEVQVDETFIGGKDINRHKNKKRGFTGVNARNADKTMVGGVDNHGQVVTKHVPSRKKVDLHPFVLANVTPGALLITDENYAYTGLAKIYDRETVNHSKDEYKNKNGFTTNKIENYWSNLKRGIYGIYHQISAKHTQAYLDEFAFRFNSREITSQERFDLALGQSDSRLTYERLIGK